MTPVNRLAPLVTYLPLYVDGRWCLISDRAIAQYLRKDENKRNERLAKTVSEAIEDGLDFEETHISQSDVTINEIVKIFDGKPILVTKKDQPEALVGILTAFDLL